MVSPHDDPIELSPSKYEAWRERYRTERSRIEDALGRPDLQAHVERIEDVGSTAVPDLVAKDIVDVNVVVADEAVPDVGTAIVQGLGGDRHEYDTEWHPVFRAANGQRFNDHVFVLSGEKWRISVVTRDVLRSRSALRDEYAALKRDLSADTDDLPTDSRGKTQFVERTLSIAREADDLTFDFKIPV